MVGRTTETGHVINKDDGNQQGVQETDCEDCRDWVLKDYEIMADDVNEDDDHNWEWRKEESGWNDEQELESGVAEARLK